MKKIEAIPPFSEIHLSPPSQQFVNARTTTLGPWVIGSSLDCLLLGIVLSQAIHFCKYRLQHRRFETFLVFFVLTLSILKSIQGIAIVWQQNVVEFANPDVARLLASSAWWQVSAPLLTGVTGCAVQLFFCMRFAKLCERWWLGLPITIPILLGVAGVCLSTFFITQNNFTLKVRWLMVHLVSVCIADVLITTGTIWALYRHNSPGFTNSASSLIKRLTRMVFEAAIPPALTATIDLILTQSLKQNLLWHLVTNYSLQKLYVISLLYTLNAIEEYRRTQNIYFVPTKSTILGRRGDDLELGIVADGRSDETAQSELSSQSQVQVQVTKSIVSRVESSLAPDLSAHSSRRWKNLIP